MLQSQKINQKHSFKVTSYTPSQKHIKNSVKYLRWRFLEKQPKTFNYFCQKLYLRSLVRFLFLPKTLSQKLGQVPIFAKNSISEAWSGSYFCEKLYLRSLVTFLFLPKTLSQKPGQVPNTCYKIVVRKFPIYKLKQKGTKKIKN